MSNVVPTFEVGERVRIMDVAGTDNGLRNKRATITKLEMYGQRVIASLDVDDLEDHAVALPTNSLSKLPAKFQRLVGKRVAGAATGPNPLGLVPGSRVRLRDVEPLTRLGLAHKTGMVMNAERGHWRVRLDDGPHGLDYRLVKNTEIALLGDPRVMEPVIGLSGDEPEIIVEEAGWLDPAPAKRQALLIAVNRLAEQMGMRPFKKIPLLDRGWLPGEQPDRTRYGTGRTTWMVLHAVQAMRVGERVAVVVAFEKDAQYVHKMIVLVWKHTRPDLPIPKFKVVPYMQRDNRRLEREATFWDHRNLHIERMRESVRLYDEAQKRIGLLTVIHDE